MTYWSRGSELYMSKLIASVIISTFAKWNFKIVEKILKGMYHEQACSCCSAIKTTRKHVRHCHTLTSSAIMAMRAELFVGIWTLLAIGMTEDDKRETTKDGETIK